MKRQAVKKLIQCAAVIAAGVLAIILFMLAIWYRGKNSEGHNKIKNKCLMVVDGKVADAAGIILVKKGVTAV